MDVEQGVGMITVITPTRDRSVPMALCERWIAHQTVKPDQWLIIDDGSAPMVPPSGADYIRREPGPGDPKHTLNLNIFTMIPRIAGDKIIVFEDDEYYAPGYIETMAKRLDEYALVGIGWSKYYHLPSGGYARHANVAHASFAQTAFRREVLPVVRTLAAVESQHYLDVRLWTKFGGAIIAAHGPGGWERKIGEEAIVFDDHEVPLYCGMKGLPGCPGIGIGHKQTHYKTFDTDLSVLRSWVPKDHGVYYDYRT